MPSVITCPACERRLNVPPDLVGEAVQCPTCGETFTADLDAPAPPRRQEGESGSRNGYPLQEPPDETPPRRSRRYEPEDDGEDDNRDDYPVRRRRPGEKPPNVNTVGVLMLIGGIFALLLAVGLPVASGAFCCLWPGTYYSLVAGILITIKASQLLGDNAHRTPNPRWAAVLMIVNIVSGDAINLAMGIVCLCLLNDREVERYFRG
jgi:hypothetical protein